MEEIESFVIDNETKALPFYIELTGITYPDTGYEIYRECSDIYVLEYVISGCGHVTVDDYSFDVGEGDVYLIPLGSRCHYYSDKDDPYKKIWMNINGELCKQLLRTYELDNIFHYKNVNIYPPFEKLLNICKNKTHTNKFIFSSCSILFFEMIQLMYLSINKTLPVNEYVLNAKQFCDMNVYEKISVTDVAASVNMSVSQINRLFKKEYGTTIYSYMLDCRIETAKSLLNNTAMTISQISDKLNFADEHYFSNIFKKKTSYAPSEYRKIN